MEQLKSAIVHCTDLRGGAALAVAALRCDGYTTLCDIVHIDRGYADFESGLSSLGANIVRER